MLEGPGFDRFQENREFFFLNIQTDLGVQTVSYAFGFKVYFSLG